MMLQSQNMADKLRVDYLIKTNRIETQAKI